jgi:hypothetical protein
MHCIKKIIAAFTAIYCSHSFAQEIILPDEIWERILISVLIEQLRMNRPFDNSTKNLIVSKQLYTVMKSPNFIKTAIAERENKRLSHYETAQMMRIPAITTPYIEANENLLRIVELTLYQKSFNNNPYADINYEGCEKENKYGKWEEGKNKLTMICSHFPEYKLEWIKWLIENGARDNNTQALGAVIPHCYPHCDCTRREHSECQNINDTYHKIVEMLLKTGGSDPNQPIHKAISQRATIVQLLIAHGATIKNHDYVWFHDYLNFNDHIDEHALKFLLDQGYDPYKCGKREDPFASNFLKRYYYELDNAIKTVLKNRPSAKRDRILSLMQQYPKKVPDGTDSN